MEYELWTKSEAYRVPDVAAHMYVAPTFGERPAHLETFQHGAPVGIDASAAAHVVWMPGDWQVFFTHMIRRMCMIAPFIRWLDDVAWWTLDWLPRRPMRGSTPGSVYKSTSLLPRGWDWGPPIDTTGTGTARTSPASPMTTVWQKTLPHMRLSPSDPASRRVPAGQVPACDERPQQRVA